MKRITVLCFLALMMGTVLPAQAQQKQKLPYPVKVCGGVESSIDAPMRIAGFTDYAPFLWIKYDPKAKKNQEYSYHGFVAKPFMAAMKDMGIVYVRALNLDNYDDALMAAKNGKLDIMMTTYFQGKEEEFVDYVYPSYFGNHMVVVSRADKKVVVNDLSELSGKIGVLREEEGVEPLIRGLLPSDTKIRVVRGAEAAFKMLMSGEADFMITSPYAAVAEARRFKIWKDVYIGEKSMRLIQLFISFSKRSRCRYFKKTFAYEFMKYFKDPAEREKMMQAAIDEWVELHKDEPPLQYEKPGSAPSGTSQPSAASAETTAAPSAQPAVQ